MWTKVCKVSEIEEGAAKTVTANETLVALFKAQGKIYALDNSCPHRGGPLGEGHLEGLEVTCPWHAWSFNVQTGECTSMPGMKQKSFPVKVEKDDVLVDA